jgi:inosine/xanthosine triphosphate pyrophosphatase family protein
MQRLPVESSDIVSIGYDPETRLLEVEFNAGRIYQYREVEPDIYEHFIRAESYGRYFYSSINGRYRYSRIDASDAANQTAHGIACVSADADEVRSVRQACEPYGIEIEQLELPVPVIQAYDPSEATLNKAKQAYKLAQRPVIVETTFWNILALHGFPGAYMAAVSEWFRPEDFLRLLADKTDRSMCRTDTLAYYDGSKRSKVCSQDQWCTLVAEPRGVGSSIEQITIINGSDRTLAELCSTDTEQQYVPDAACQELAKWLNLRKRLAPPSHTS